MGSWVGFWWVRWAAKQCAALESAWLSLQLRQRASMPCLAARPTRPAGTIGRVEVPQPGSFLLDLKGGQGSGWRHGVGVSRTSTRAATPCATLTTQVGPTISHPSPSLPSRPGIRYEGELVPLATTAALVRLKPGGDEAVRWCRGCGATGRWAGQPGTWMQAGDLWEATRLSRIPGRPCPASLHAPARRTRQEVEALLPALLRCQPGGDLDGQGGADLLRCAPPRQADGPAEPPAGWPCPADLPDGWARLPSRMAHHASCSPYPQRREMMAYDSDRYADSDGEGPGGGGAKRQRGKGKGRGKAPAKGHGGAKGGARKKPAAKGRGLGGGAKAGGAMKAAAAPKRPVPKAAAKPRAAAAKPAKKVAPPAASNSSDFNSD